MGPHTRRSLERLLLAVQLLCCLSGLLVLSQGFGFRVTAALNATMPTVSSLAAFPWRSWGGENANRLMVLGLKAEGERRHLDGLWVPWAALALGALHAAALLEAGLRGLKASAGLRWALAALSLGSLASGFVVLLVYGLGCWPIGAKFYAQFVKRLSPIFIPSAR